MGGELAVAGVTALAALAGVWLQSHLARAADRRRSLLSERLETYADWLSKARGYAARLEELRVEVEGMFSSRRASPGEQPAEGERVYGALEVSLASDRVRLLTRSEDVERALVRWHSCVDLCLAVLTEWGERGTWSDQAGRDFATAREHAAAQERAFLAAARAELAR